MTRRQNRGAIFYATLRTRCGVGLLSPTTNPPRSKAAWMHITHSSRTPDRCVEDDGIMNRKRRAIIIKSVVGYRHLQQ